MEDLVDEAHCIDHPCMNGLLREFDEVSFFVHPLRKYPCSVEVWEDDIPAEGEQGVVKTIEIPCLS